MTNLLDKLMSDPQFSDMLSRLDPAEREKVMGHINKTLRPIVDNFSNLSATIQSDPKKREDLFNSLKQKDT
jgi:hypothetical protein